jgi:uroporphyrin-III C-methyltransferase / precorrin-2 dehydrogenase / sirohydrochlorin ferrochelatase
MVEDPADASVQPGARARGRVTLVGAGPGAADLLTVRGLRRLGEADLVLYDALSSEEMRAYAPSARWFYVGKRACRQSIGQSVLNRLMVREAMRGFHVVRLKCGDPFVFGRGGEELLALAEAGIPCEVVPGVSSSVAGPLLAGIPVTHRGAASAFTVIAGHHEATFRPLLATLPSRGMTLVVLMGLRQRPALSRALLEFGWSPETPCAIVLGAATPQAWSWRGCLAAVADVALPPGEVDEAGAPGLLVIGEVVAVADEVERLRAVATVTRPAETPRDDAPVQMFTPKNRIHGQGGTR